MARMNSLLLHTVANWDSCMSTTGFSLSGKTKEWEQSIVAMDSDEKKPEALLRLFDADVKCFSAIN